ncbi:Putative toxin regulator [Apilactobacillus apinorum]|nr:putative toxin regulator [Apilactobacillus apinorum]CAI2627627.1 Putative toxin regulator [Apilactobacillus apinorum]
MIYSTAKDSPQMDAANMADYKAKSGFKDSVYLVFNGVSNAILVCLGVGLLLGAIANFVHWPALAQIGLICQYLMAPAIGAAVASQLKTNTLVLFSSMIAATVGANNVFFTSAVTNAVTATGHVLPQPAGSAVFMIGQPVSALGGAVVATMIGKYLTGKTPLDMFLVPFSATGIGSIAALAFATVTTPALVWLSGVIAKSMVVNPFLGSFVIAVVWSVFLMTPASSAALAIAVMLDPLSSGAALLGTTAQFVSYTVMSYRVNKPGANIAQGLITPKVQFGNITKNPYIVIPGMVSSAIIGPIGTLVFHFSISYKLAGLGLNSLIAPITIASQSISELITYLVLGVVVPAVISVVLVKVLKAAHKIKDEDMRIDLV